MWETRKSRGKKNVACSAEQHTPPRKKKSSLSYSAHISSLRDDSYLFPPVSFFFLTLLQKKTAGPQLSGGTRHAPILGPLQKPLAARKRVRTPARNRRAGPFCAAARIDAVGNSRRTRSCNSCNSCNSAAQLSQLCMVTRAAAAAGNSWQYKPRTATWPYIESAAATAATAPAAAAASNSRYSCTDNDEKPQRFRYVYVVVSVSYI